MKNALLFPRWILGAGMLAAAIGIGLLGLSSTFATNISGYEPGHDDHGSSDHESSDDDDSYSMGSAGFIANDTYIDECSTCHMPYPPMLLPKAGWAVLMSGLEDHFGDNAELEVETRDTILAYLQTNAADSGRSRLGAKILRGSSAISPVRITELAYFQDEHDEIPAKMVKDNPDVRLFSNCSACHGNAERGEFDEDTVDIPGYGRWDD